MDECSVSNIASYGLELLQPAILLKVTILRGRFSCFQNCTNGTKLRKASHTLKHRMIPIYAITRM